MDAPPAWAIEDVHLSGYDPRWPDRAAGYAEELRPLLGQWLLGPIEHVGPTAILAIVAKPVIDLMAQVTDPDTAGGQAGGERGLRHARQQFEREREEGV